MKTKIIITTLVFALGTVASAVLADSHLNGAVRARQAEMQLRSFNVGILAKMAQGIIDYDAGAATAAAANLLAVASLNEGAMWPQGSDNDALGDLTRAKPELWGNFADLVEKVTGMHDAAADMNAVAGIGLAELQAALGPVGQACGACHKAYRGPKP